MSAMSVTRAMRAVSTTGQVKEDDEVVRTELQGADMNETCNS
ncbi:hypothetical protein [Paenibacillus planticolens]|nr:hypothetical protein [Paenibacillus planticolens]